MRKPLLLTAAEEHALIARAQAGDVAATETLLRAQEGVIAKKVAQISGFFRHTDAEDLMQIGRLAILTAIQKFDLARGGRLSTYVCAWLRGRFQRAQEADPHIRIPTHQYQKHGNEGVKERFPACTQSLDFEIGYTDSPGWEENTHTLIELLRAPNDTCAEAIGATDDEQADWLADAIHRHLDERDRYALTETFGLDGREPRTLHEVGRDLGICREGVRQIQIRAIQRLRAEARREGLLR